MAHRDRVDPSSRLCATAGRHRRHHSTTQADPLTGVWSAIGPAGGSIGVAFQADTDNDNSSVFFSFGATIQGSVLGDGGTVLPNSGVAACPVPVTPGPNGLCVGLRFAFHDGTGNFVLDGIPPGTYSVVGFQLPQPGGPVSTEVIVDLAADDVLTCTFTLGTNPSGSCGGDFAVPETKDDCKKGGRQGLTDDEGTPLKNQGDCVSFVATGGKNKADG